MYAKIFFIFLIVIGYGYTQDSDELLSLSLEELLSMNIEVETASKKAEDLVDAPGIISVVTAAEIRDYGARNLKDILNRVTSIYILSTYFGHNNFASFRGDSQSHYDTHTLVLLNGRPLRESLTSSFNAAIYNSFPIQTIERIEVIRGPGSVLYGAGAFSGVINLITRSKDKETTIQVDAGRYHSTTAKVHTRGQNGDFNYLVAGSISETDGWAFQAVDEAGQDRSWENGQEGRSLLSDLNYKEFYFTGLFIRDNQTYWGSTPNVGPLTREVERTFYNLGWQKDVSTKWNLEANLTYNKIQIDPDTTDTEAEDTLFEVTAQYNANKKTNILFGASSNQKKGAWGTPAAYFVPPYDKTDYSGYFQLDYRPKDWVKLIMGGQFNKPDSQSTDFVPRLAAIFKFKGNQGIKLLQGEAFRSPASNETDFDTTIIGGNPDLSPEKVATTEIQYFVKQKAWWLNVTAFHVEQNDLIGRTFNQGEGPLFVYDNLGNSKFNGIELEGKYAFNEKVILSLGSTYQENENGNGQDDFTGLPNHMTKLGLSVKLSEEADLGLFDTYMGDSPDVASVNPNRRLVNPEADSYHLLTANINIDLKSRFQSSLKECRLSFYAHNLLDEDIYINEFVRRQINSMPLDGGMAFNGKLAITF